MRDGWQIRPLREVTSKIGSGATPFGGEAVYKVMGISLIRSLNVYDDGFRTKNLAFIDETQAAKLDNVIVEAGDVLLTSLERRSHDVALFQTSSFRQESINMSRSFVQ